MCCVASLGLVMPQMCVHKVRSLSSTTASLVQNYETRILNRGQTRVSDDWSLTIVRRLFVDAVDRGSRHNNAVAAID